LAPGRRVRLDIRSTELQQLSGRCYRGAGRCYWTRSSYRSRLTAARQAVQSSERTSNRALMAIQGKHLDMANVRGRLLGHHVGWARGARREDWVISNRMPITTWSDGPTAAETCSSPTSPALESGWELPGTPSIIWCCSEWPNACSPGECSPGESWQPLDARRRAISCSSAPALALAFPCIFGFF